VVSTGWAGTTTGESAVSREWLFATTKSYRPINYLTPLVGEGRFLMRKGGAAAFVAAQRSNLVRHAFEFAPRPVQKSQQMSA
jgi:hypothetical protein